MDKGRWNVDKGLNRHGDCAQFGVRVPRILNANDPRVQMLRAASPYREIPPALIRSDVEHSATFQQPLRLLLGRIWDTDCRKRVK